MDKMIFKALFEHSSLGILISNSDGIIEQSNPYAAKIFGYNPHELEGQAVEVLIPNHLREKHILYRNKYIENPSPRSMGSTLNLLALKKNGELFPVEISLSYFETNGQRQVVSFINDITERKRAEDQLKKMKDELESKINERTRELSDALLELNHTNEGLELEMEQRRKIETQMRQTLEKEKELNELKSRFVSMASHEFRTPLGGILTSASLLARYDKPEDKPKRDKHIHTIKKSVRNLTAILNDFLSLDKLEQGAVRSRPIQFNLKKMLEDTVEEMQDLLDHGRNMIMELKNCDVPLFQDKDMLRNVVINLLSNAIKYSPPDSPVNIMAQTDKEWATIKIVDHGIGIPPADQKHLFERFFRAHNVTTVQGTGLGLNIVKRYLDLMGGSIQFTSVENQGTTFTFTIPLEKRDEEDSAN